MIRNFREEDREKYIEMSKIFYSSSAVSHDIDHAHFNRTFDHILAGSPYAIGVMIECDNKVVGYGLIALSYSNEAGGMNMLLDELYIMDEYRGRGLGREFFEYAESLPLDIKRYRLEVTHGNRAKHLYDRLGYKELDYIQMIKDVE